jgi:hypothetical protein
VGPRPKRAVRRGVVDLMIQSQKGGIERMQNTDFEKRNSLEESLY